MPDLSKYACAKCSWRTKERDKHDFGEQPTIYFCGPMERRGVCMKTLTLADGSEHLHVKCPRCDHETTRPCDDSPKPEETGGA